MERCLKMAEKFVMKPQREGGGNMQKFFFKLKKKEQQNMRGFPILISSLFDFLCLMFKSATLHFSTREFPYII